MGAIAGATFAAGTLLMAVTAAAPEAASLGFVITCIGSVLLGIAWLGALRDGHGGAGAILGSVAIPAAIAYVYLHRHEWELARIHGLLVSAAFAAWNWGHACARVGIGTRIMAGFAGSLWILTLVVGGAAGLVLVVTAFVGCMLMLEMLTKDA